MAQTFTGLQLHSTITDAGQLRLELADITMTDPAADEVIVKVEAAPINPSDLFLLFGPADPATLRADGTAERPVISAPIPPAAMSDVKARLNQPMKPGNEGAGTVVAAGSNARHLLGRRVGMWGGQMYAHYRTLPFGDCIALPDGATAIDGAAMFVNPLTALCFIETMKMEKHKAIVHFAAASNLGRMLNRICLKDGIPLVNVVRSQQQAAILREEGASWVLDSTAADFDAQLTEVVASTGATLAFDPIGGGRQAGQVLASMETAASRGMTTYNRYGSGTFKQVYIYGALAPLPTVLDRWIGYAWSLGGWLLTYRLQQIGPQGIARLHARIADELTTTFASHYTASLNLVQALRPENAQAYLRRATGEKVLITPFS